MIAGAITLREHPVYWRGVDGTTHGPLDDYALLLAPALGLPLDYSGPRFVVTLLQAFTLLAVWIAARRLLDPVSARLGVLPAILLWGGAFFFELFQYTSETLPIFLIAAGGALGAVGLTTAASTRKRAALFAAAGLLGMVPFAKLQGVPLAAAIGLLLMLAVWRAAAGRTRWVDLGWLVGGALAPTALLLAGLSAFGLFHEFYVAYWQSNLAYAGQRLLTYAQQFQRWTAYLQETQGALPFFQGTLAATLLLLLPALWGARRIIVILGWALALLGFYTVIAPGRHYLHYFNFLVAPGAFLLAASLHSARAALEKRSSWVAWSLTLVALVVALGPSVTFWQTYPNPYVAAYAGPTATGESAIGRQLRGFRRASRDVGLASIPLHRDQSVARYARRPHGQYDLLRPAPRLLP